jgi:hypothetical protein
MHNKNQIHIKNEYFDAPDIITVCHNDIEIYHGPADLGVIDFVPTIGINTLTVTLDKKMPGNFFYNSTTDQLEKDSKIIINEIIVESRYFRLLVIKCGLVEIDLAKNLSFPSKYVAQSNVLTMEGSKYFIKFKSPIKKWMHVHLHGTDLDTQPMVNSTIKEKIFK